MNILKKHTQTEIPTFVNRDNSNNRNNNSNNRANNKRSRR